MGDSVAKVTSKLQVTIPKAIATAHHIEPGCQLIFESAGECIRLRSMSRGEVDPVDDPGWRLRLFEEASGRQEGRNRRFRRKQSGSKSGARGWSREDLYDRGSSR